MPFPITEGLDAVWGYRPSPADMRRLLDIFAYSRELVTDELAEVATWPASSPASRRRSARCSPPHGSAGWTPWPRPTTTSGASRTRRSWCTARDDRVIPLATSLRLLQLIDDSRLHVFGRCGRWTQIEHSAEFNRLLIDFLARRD